MAFCCSTLSEPMEAFTPRTRSFVWACTGRDPRDAQRMQPRATMPLISFVIWSSSSGPRDEVTLPHLRCHKSHDLSDKSPLAHNDSRADWRRIASFEEAQLAITAGAAALGLVASMPSGPGPIPDHTIAAIAAFAPP